MLGFKKGGKDAPPPRTRTAPCKQCGKRLTGRYNRRNPETGAFDGFVDHPAPPEPRRCDETTCVEPAAKPKTTVAPPAAPSAGGVVSALSTRASKLLRLKKRSAAADAPRRPCRKRSGTIVLSGFANAPELAHRIAARRM